MTGESHDCHGSFQFFHRHRGVREGGLVTSGLGGLMGLGVRRIGANLQGGDCVHEREDRW